MQSHTSQQYGNDPFMYRLHYFLHFQTEIVKRMSAIIGQVLPFLSQEHQQQVATAVERAKQVTMSDLNSVVGVSISLLSKSFVNREV